MAINQKLLKFPNRIGGLIALLSILVFLAGCGGGSTKSSSPTPENPPPPPPPETAPADPTLPIAGFVPVSKSSWDNLAVRNVLHTFAFGGHASDAQIQAWADLDPVTAIEQMLTFEPHNALLSPDDTDQLSQRSGKLRELAQFWASSSTDNPIPTDYRERFDYENHGGWMEHMWPTTATLRGLNPFRQKVVYWETNQHMAVNLNRAIPPTVLLQYYDDIAQALEQNLPYDEVITKAALSAAVTIQYGHLRNRFIDGECLCNEDFAREYYQLFFGITGADDSERHETVTIKNTAKALTGLRVVHDDDGILSPETTFVEEIHFQGNLEMLNQQIGGSNPLERFSITSTIAIEHPESLANLPVMIIKGLADDNLDQQDISQIRQAWASMNQKDLLLFLRAYAISTIFHDSSRIKYLTSLDRKLLLTNKVSSRNDEIYKRVYSIVGHKFEGVETFRPIDNVFGGQKGEAAANSTDVFLARFNRSTEHSYEYRRYDFDENGYLWQKDWRDVIPGASDPNFTVAEAAEWLWNHLIADQGKNFGELEKAHLYALLAAGRDISAVINEEDLERVVSVSDIINDTVLAANIESLGEQTLGLTSTDADQKRLNNFKVGQAVNFISSTPFMYYQEGR